MTRSEFKRLQKIEKGLPKSGVKFLEEKGIFMKGHTLIAGWYKGDLRDTRNYVVVLQSIEDETYTVVTSESTESCDSLYQAFLAHKAARFA